MLPKATTHSIIDTEWLPASEKPVNNKSLKDINVMVLAPKPSINAEIILDSKHIKVGIPLKKPIQQLKNCHINWYTFSDLI